MAVSRSVIEIVDLHSHAAAPFAECRHVILSYESYDAFVMFPNSSLPTSGVTLEERPLLECGCQSAWCATQSSESARLGDGEQDAPG